MHLFSIYMNFVIVHDVAKIRQASEPGPLPSLSIRRASTQPSAVRVKDEHTESNHIKQTKMKMIC